MGAFVIFSMTVGTVLFMTVGTVLFVKFFAELDSLWYYVSIHRYPQYYVLWNLVEYG